MGDERLQKMKLDRLKYTNIPWVQVKSTFIKPSMRFGRSVSRSSSVMKRTPRIQQTTKPFFSHSAVQFTDTEYSILKKADADNESNNPNLLCTRSPSRLQQLQHTHEERLSDANLLASSSRRSTANNSPQKIQPVFETVDSIISFKPVYDIDDDDDDINVNKKENTKSTEFESQILTSGPVTIEDIQEHVWIYSHEMHSEAKEKTVSDFDAEVIENRGNLPKVIKHVKRGQMKIERALYDNLSADEEIEYLNNKNRKMIDDSLREKLETSYSALKYKKIAYANQNVLPDFIDDLDFARLKIKRKTAKDTVRKGGWGNYILRKDK